MIERWCRAAHEDHILLVLPPNQPLPPGTTVGTTAAATATTITNVCFFPKIGSDRLW